MCASPSASGARVFCRFELRGVHIQHNTQWTRRPLQYYTSALVVAAYLICQRDRPEFQAGELKRNQSERNRFYNIPTARPPPRPLRGRRTRQHRHLVVRCINLGGAHQRFRHPHRAARPAPPDVAAESHPRHAERYI